ncbi:MAG TPA: DinB family protein, partial [Longimicrobium sp.]
LTYARGEALSEEQFAYLRAEQGPGDPTRTAADLVGAMHAAVDRALAQIRATSPDALLEFRGVGRQQLPSNVLGLLFHAAEHTQRHTGQAITTARIVRGLADH